MKSDYLEHLLQEHIIAVNTIFKMANDSRQYIVKKNRGGHIFNIKTSIYVHNEDIFIEKIAMKFFIKKGNCEAFLIEKTTKVNYDEQRWDLLRHIESEIISKNLTPRERKLHFKFKNEDEIKQIFSLLI